MYNYLFAKKNNGTFILRIEDTDQTRYVQGAEEYIKKSLSWLGLEPDEGPDQGGEYGPYRQSERKDLYGEFARKLVDMGYAYFAFDTPEELEKWREEMTKKGIHSPKYDFSTRLGMKNSLTLGKEKAKEMIASGIPFVVRLKVPENEVITFNDIVRGEVSFSTNELDDKVILKADGLPTYHLANIVDDHFMKISHVIRGEEWLSSTAHHILLYRYLCWEDTMPKFAHLPLLLKPVGKGKLSKRDGAKFGFPVFPLNWQGENLEDKFAGFKEFGFLPEATINFLALLGWNPGNDEEMFDMDSLVEIFSLEKIVKSGARFNIEKAKWFNQQYILQKTDEQFAVLIKPYLEKAGYDFDEQTLLSVAKLMKPRIELLTEITEKAKFFFKDNFEYDQKIIRKKWKSPNKENIFELKSQLQNLDEFDKNNIEKIIKDYIQENNLSFGNIFPLLRVALTGTTKGPDLFETMEIIGKTKTLLRLDAAFDKFEVILK